MATQGARNTASCRISSQVAFSLEGSQASGHVCSSCHQGSTVTAGQTHVTKRESFVKIFVLYPKYCVLVSPACMFETRKQVGYTWCALGGQGRGYLQVI